MTPTDDLLVRIRRGAGTPGQEGADRPLLLGTMARLLTGIAACRLVERRLLAFPTLLSECLPARARVGAGPDTCLHDLLLDRSPAAEALLASCLEAVSGEPVARLVAEEVAGPAGLRSTFLLPQPTSTAHDLDRLLVRLAGDALLGARSRDQLLDRGYGIARVRRGAVSGYGSAGTGPGGPVLAHHYPQLGLTVVARGRPATHLPDEALADDHVAAGGPT